MRSIPNQYEIRTEDYKNITQSGLRTYYKSTPGFSDAYVMIPIRIPNFIDRYTRALLIVQI